MPEVTHAVHYFRFMKWFKKNHHALFVKYQLNIIVPAKTNTIMAAMDYIEPYDKPVLQAVINEFYTTVAD